MRQIHYLHLEGRTGDPSNYGPFGQTSAACKILKCFERNAKGETENMTEHKLYLNNYFSR